MNGTYKYYAFISYKHADAHHAKWIQNKLQNYRLPARLQKSVDGERIRLQEQDKAPKRLSPVFRDQSDLVPGILSESLYAALAESRYLIVICSRNAARNSTYLDLEIRSFLDSGHRVDQIIPLIVDTDSKKPEEECFPEALRELNSQHALLGVNFKDSPEKTEAARKNDAFLKIIAYMLGVQMPEVKNLDKRRRKRNALWAAGAAVLALAMVICGLCYYDRHYRPHITYFRDYVLRDNVAQGIYPLEKGELAGELGHYCFTTVDGAVRSVEYRNSQGQIKYPQYNVLNQGAARIEYTYTKTAEGLAPESATFYNHMGQLLVCHNFWDGGTRVSFSRQGNSAAASYISASTPQSGLAIDFDRSMISKFIQSFEDGRMTMRMFAHGDRYNPTHNGGTRTIPSVENVELEEVIYGYLFQYDDMGRVTRLTYMGDAQGTPDGIQEGINAITYTYDDATGQLVRTDNWNLYGDPALNGEGWASKIVELDEKGYPAAELYLDARGNPTRIQAGYAGLGYGYEGSSRVTQYYLDENRNLLELDGYAIEYYGRDDRGIVISCGYFDSQGQRALRTSEGCYGWHKTYLNEVDTITIYSDENGDPMPGKPVVQATTAFETDASGETVYVQTEAYFDAEGQPVADGPAYCRYVFDENAYRFLESSFHLADGTLTMGPHGYARRTMEYSPYGEKEVITEFDAQGGELERYEYYFNMQGYLIRTMVCTGGDPATMEGAAVLRQEDGRVLEICMIDGEQNLLENQDGVAVNLIGYDDEGRMNSFTSLNADRLPASATGSVRSEYAYDSWGNLLRTDFYGIAPDARGSYRFVPVNEDGGFARAQYSYDDRGALTDVRYYGARADGTVAPRVVAATGYAGVSFQYDEYGNCTSITYYGAQEDSFVPAIPRGGSFARTDARYDARGNCLYEEYFAFDGENFVPQVVPEYGYSRVEYRYDDQGNLLGKETFSE